MLGRISSVVGPLSTHPRARVAYRYYRFNTTKVRDKTADALYAEGIVQISQFELMYVGGFLSYSGATATNPSGDNPLTEEPDKAIDGSVDTNGDQLGGVPTDNKIGERATNDIGIDEIVIKVNKKVKVDLRTR